MMEVEKSDFSIFTQLSKKDNPKPLTEREHRFASAKGDFTKHFTKKEYEAFMTNFSQSISDSIQRDTKEAEKAARKLKASAKGEDYHDVE